MTTTKYKPSQCDGTEAGKAPDLSAAPKDHASEHEQEALQISWQRCMQASKDLDAPSSTIEQAVKIKDRFGPEMSARSIHYIATLQGG